MHDALFMQGYLHAYEHLFHMDLARRTAYGELSSLFGETSLPSDKFARALNIRELAIHDLKGSSENELRILQAYSNGVNHYINGLRRHSFPIEYWIQYGVRLLLENREVISQWDPVDTLAIMRLQAFECSHSWNDELTSWLLGKNIADLYADNDVHQTDFPEHSETLGGSIWLFRTNSGTIIRHDSFEQVG
jgi:penicillin amidase